MDTLKIRDARDVEQAVQAAIAAGQPLEIVGHGTKRAIGQPMATNAMLDLSALNGVTSYEPNELIITTAAGAPLADLTSLIDSKNQEFAFEPMDTSALLGTPPLRGTIGGVIAAGLAGPRRIKSGSARDHLLGLTGVSGFGETFHAGGKVVKNVTGYDLCKLVAGSWGTLAVMTEVTLKVMPKAEAEVTLVLRGLDEVMATKAMSAALGTPFDISGVSHLPATTMRSANGALSSLGAEQSLTLMRLEGYGASVAHRANCLQESVAAFGAADRLDHESSRAAWAAIRDVTPFAMASALGDRPVWRIVCPPASGGAFGQALAHDTGAELIYNWGGGLIWAALPSSADAGAQDLRARLKAIDGHATLIRASDEVRAAVDVFHPHSAGVAALNQRVKASFDPRDILNRGRMAKAASA